MNEFVSRVPSFAAGVRLHRDQVRQRWVLLAPERVIELDAIAYAVLALVDGERDLAGIVQNLAEQFDAEPRQLRNDVVELLDELAAKRLLR